MLTKAVILSRLTALNIYNFTIKVPGKRIDLIYHMMQTDPFNHIR